MIYQAHIERVGPHVADGLADNLLITFLADGPADCLDYALALRPVFSTSMPGYGRAIGSRSGARTTASPPLAATPCRRCWSSGT